MTLFIQTPTRKFEISELYAAALSFLIFFAVGKVVTGVIEKQKQKKAKNIDVPNPKGGDLVFQFSDDTELGYVILSCIADNQRYLVRDPEVIKAIFALVKAKLKNESLVLTPNMIRFLALKLINNDQTLIVRFGNIIVSSNNRARLLTRIVGGAIIGFVGAVAATLPYAILLFLVYFDVTENCGYKCSNYFETLPKEGPVRIYGEESTGHLVIAGNDDARQLQIYIPSKAAEEVTVVSNNGEVKATKAYTRARRKAREVKFSDFKQTDPVLSSFKDLPEPEIPQRICPINDIHDFIDIQVE